MDFLDICEKAARDAGDVLRARIGKVTPRLKGRSDLVTEADLAAQEVVRQTVLGAFPDHVLLGEEDDEAGSGGARSHPSYRAVQHPESLRGRYRWIVDPLDGTTNFVHQLPFYSVSLALEHDGELLVGAVYDPSADECFSAAAGRGATRNGMPIRTSQVTTLENALVSAGFPNVVTDETPDLKMFLAAMRVCQALRRTGSAALNLAYVAAGRFDAAWSFSTKVWDVAAGVLLIREAGGVIVSCDAVGSPLEDGTYLAAANPVLHAELVELARKAGTQR